MYTSTRGKEKPFFVDDDDLVNVINFYGHKEGPRIARHFDWRCIVAYEIVEKAEKKRKIEFMIDQVKRGVEYSTPSDINKILDFLYEEHYLDEEKIELDMRDEDKP